jgi:hypothetical protein
MKTEEDFEVLRAATAAEFPDFEVISKSKSTLMKLINFLLLVITFGKMNSFMTRFTTTMGTKVYVPDEWHDRPVESRLIVLRHERVHMRQAKKYGRLLFSLMYMALPFPVVFAYYRRKFEQEAYEESLIAMKEYYGNLVLKNPGIRTSMIEHFTTAEYYWAWPWKKSIESWFDKFVSSL